MSVVAKQFAPDGSFPTLPFPNPEEPGALDLAMATATEANAELILANDPDADRLGAAVRDGSKWRALRGDEIGWLLASDAARGDRGGEGRRRDHDRLLDVAREDGERARRSLARRR